MNQFVIVGAGVIGLALAEELAGRGHQVLVLEKDGARDRRTSWAAAGIIPPTNRQLAHDTYGRLCGLSYEIYPDWTARLREETGVDPEYIRCGGIQLARSVGECVALKSAVALWQQDGVEVEAIDDVRLVELEPALQALVARRGVRAAYHVPGEAQVRSSRLVDALLAACRNKGVTVRGDVEVLAVDERPDGALLLRTNCGEVAAERVCLTAGAWVDQILHSRDVHLDVQPWRGQIALLQTPPGFLRHVVNEGPNYLVPRQDGRVVVGASVEEVGYDWGMTAAIDQLREFAVSLVPELAAAEVIDAWSGLRPHTNDGMPYLGKIPGLEHGFVAAGHFRSGIVLAPATASVMADAMLGATPRVEIGPFRLDR